MRPAVFLDRDGVIIQNVADYVRSCEDIAFITSTLAALKHLAQSNYRIVMVTNQSAIGRGIISFSQSQEINRQIIDTISKAGGRVDGLYLCPHAPTDQCYCRKPKPGLILQAAQDLSIDLSHSVMIGDALTDIQAGQAAGVPTNILVKTGRGADQLRSPLVNTLPSFQVFVDLFEAVEFLLRKSS